LPTKLSFANTVNNTGSDTDGVSYSPNLGGQFGGSLCLTDVDSQNNTQNVSASPGTPYNVNGLIPGGTLPEGTSTSIFVTGDAYISGNIIYGSNGSWNVTTPGDTPPAFTLHATGNIYIAPGVTTLYGQYIADGSDSAEPTSGKIYTCANSTGTGPITDTTVLYADCNRQLNVYGNFVAKQTNLMRTYGSLRDETPNPGSAGSAGGSQIGFQWTEVGGSTGISGMTCTQVNEPGEPVAHTWSDNFLCVPSSSSVKLGWTWADGGGAPEAAIQTGQPNCINLDPPNLGSDAWAWTDNYLCSNTTGLSFSYSGVPGGSVVTDGVSHAADVTIVSTRVDPITNITYATAYSDSSTNQYCTQLYEDSDPDGSTSSPAWQNTYLCEPLAAAATLPGPPTPHVANPCSNAPAGFTPGSPQTCAAEVFYADPSRYLNNPGSGSGSTGGGENQAQSITSLPPVL